MQYTVSFPTGAVDYRFGSSLADLPLMAPPQHSIVITDSNFHEAYGEDLKDYQVLVMPAGEEHKTWETARTLIQQMIALEAHRKTTLIGIGGGVVTDITGFIASIYMRGIDFGFVPTTLLSMVDAAVGGKNGINLGLHKNMLGTFTQPRFILYDVALLRTMTDTQWSNGFGEIIKYGCICDIRIINTLRQGDIRYFRKRPDNINELISGCVHVKNKIVSADEKESGIRKILNFGHTAGHAFEVLYQLPHGHSIALGMLAACKISEQISGLDNRAAGELRQIMEQYQLPTSLSFDIDQVMNVLHMDKKRDTDTVEFVLLERLGKARVQSLPFSVIREGLAAFQQLQVAS